MQIYVTKTPSNLKISVDPGKKSKIINLGPTFIPDYRVFSTRGDISISLQFSNCIFFSAEFPLKCCNVFIGESLQKIELILPSLLRLVKIAPIFR